MMIRTDKKGFTLIELMIVVAIIGILAAIAIPAYSDYTKKSRVSEIANALGAAVSAMQTFHSEKGTWGTLTGGNMYDFCANTAGVTLPVKYVANAGYIADVYDGTTLTVHALFSDTAPQQAIGPDITGTTLVLSSGADGGARNWPDTATIPSKYRPKN